MTVHLKQIISGGQTGVDQAALWAAHSCGLDIGGWCPPGRVCEDGTIPAHLELNETPQDRSGLTPDVPRSMRTEWNVRDSDATLILYLVLPIDPVTKATRTFCYRHDRPLLEVSLLDQSSMERVQHWLGEHKVRVLNVGGPSRKMQPGIGEAAFGFLTKLFAP